MTLNTGYINSNKKGSITDEQLTPRYAVVPLLKYIKILHRNKKFKFIWCPFDKKSSFYCRVFKKAGYTVLNSHLKYKQDFFKIRPNNPNYIIISNPPYSIKDEILARCYKLNKPFALLLPLPSLQSDERVDMFVDKGIQLLSFNKRIGYYTKGNLSKIQLKNHFASAYFCWKFLPKDLMIEKIEVIQEPYKKKYATSPTKRK